MSDVAFKQAAYPAFTKAQLILKLSGIEKTLHGLPKVDDYYLGLVGTVQRMKAEIIRRDRVEAGDMSVMTDGERLRHIREIDARGLDRVIPVA